MGNIKKLTVCLMFVMAGCFLLFSSVPALAADKTVTIGTGSGSWGDTVSVPITIDDAAGVGGVAFTLTFNSQVFTFAGIEKVTKDVSDGSEYYDSGTGEYVVSSGDVQTVSDTMFFQTNGNVSGNAMIAAASAKALTDTSLFKAKFIIKNSGYGTYPIGIVKTTISNPAAGYTTPTSLPVLVGMPADQADSNGYYQTSVYDATLVAGSITVSPLSTNPAADSTLQITGITETPTVEPGETYGTILKAVGGAGAGNFEWKVTTDPSGTFGDWLTADTFQFIAPDTGSFAGEYEITVRDKNNTSFTNTLKIKVPVKIDPSSRIFTEKKLDGNANPQTFSVTGASSDFTWEILSSPTAAAEVATPADYGSWTKASPVSGDATNTFNPASFG